MPNIAIIGAGVNGVSSAIKILEHYRFNEPNTPIQVTIHSDEFTPNTTGDGSAGLWGPYLLGGTDEAKVYKWSKSMHDFLEKIWLSEDAGEAGVCLIPCVRLSTTESSVGDFWRDIVYGSNDLTPKQLQRYNEGRTVKFTSGLSFVTYTSEPVKLLPFLMKRFLRNGGKIVRQKVTDLDNFILSSPYDVIVNCTGLGSRELLDDQQMYAVRGQVSRIKANWIYTAILDESDDGNYIIPNCETVVLGGTHQVKDYNVNVSPSDKSFILEGCRRFVPGIEYAQHLKDWVGLRPGRGELRLEAEKRGGKVVIHNYGHGGSGVTLCWGCADDVLQLLLQSKSVSKL
ncbi:D-amino acid oxidase [Drosophila tropicalis]|uniref:D-amino acid oxidase n=1 Tax=Drosophila tropicalis TaxID=46794 RepID=UPI0035ABEA1E